MARIPTLVRLSVAANIAKPCQHRNPEWFLLKLKSEETIMKSYV